VCVCVCVCTCLHVCVHAQECICACLHICSGLAAVCAAETWGLHCPALAHELWAPAPPWQSARLCPLSRPSQPLCIRTPLKARASCRPLPHAPLPPQRAAYRPRARVLHRHPRPAQPSHAGQGKRRVRLCASGVTNVSRGACVQAGQLGCARTRAPAVWYVCGLGLDGRACNSATIETPRGAACVRLLLCADAWLSICCCADAKGCRCADVRLSVCRCMAEHLPLCRCKRLPLCRSKAERLQMHG